VSIARADNPNPPPLTLVAVVDEATALIEDEGFDALTMRRLAKRLGVGPMTLYGQISSREELLGAIADRYFEDIEVPATDGLAWQEVLTVVFRAVHRSLLAHSALSKILAVQHIDGIAFYRHVEVVLEALDATGLDEREAVRCVDALTSYAMGFTQRKAEIRRRATVPEERLRRIRQLPAEEFPRVLRVAGPLVTWDVEDHFDHGLGLLIAGVERQVAAAASG